MRGLGTGPVGVRENGTIERKAVLAAWPTDRPKKCADRVNAVITKKEPMPMPTICVWVAPANYSAGAPAVPYVRALAHTVLLAVDSLHEPRHMRHSSHSMAASADTAIRHRYGDTPWGRRCIPRSSRCRFHVQTPAFPPQGRGSMGRCPGFTGTTRTLRLPAALPASTSFSFARRYHGCLRCFAPCGR